jgi:BlaI family transcriptional regulator, penicillinase repressor
MSRETPEPLTAAEWKVMKIVWRKKSCSARDVYEEAGAAYGWAPTTTKTLLRRLVEKKHLTATAVGTSYLYRPARPAWPSLAGAADALMGNTLEGLDGKLLAYMVKKSRLTPNDLAQLRAILDEHAAADGDHPVENAPLGEEAER